MCFVQFITSQGDPIVMRVGVHSGPVVGGVVGVDAMPRFHFFGETVAICEKVEAHGRGGTVHASQATVALLQDAFVAKPAGSFSFNGRDINHFELQQHTVS